MMTYESAALGYSDFPLTEEPVYLLGTKYSALYGKDQWWRNNAQPECITLISNLWKWYTYHCQWIFIRVMVNHLFWLVEKLRWLLHQLKNLIVTSYISIDHQNIILIDNISWVKKISFEIKCYRNKLRVTSKYAFIKVSIQESFALSHWIHHMYQYPVETERLQCIYIIKDVMFFSPSVT